MYLLDADEHWSWYVQLTVLEVKEHTGTSKNLLLVPVILYVLITCHKNCGCLALRLVGRSKQHGLKFDRILKSQILKEWISLLGQRMHGKQVQVMR